MKNERLPPELERLERSLAGGPRFEPSDALRQRVLYGVHAELGRQRRAPRWRFAAAAAAAVFVWIGVSLLATRWINSALGSYEPPPAVNELARRIQRSSPDFSPEEAMREAVRLQIGVELSSRSILADQWCLDRIEEYTGARQRTPQTPREPPRRTDRQPDRPEENPQSNGVSRASESQYV